MGITQQDVLGNPVLERMRTGGVALGMNVRMSRSADVVRIARATGHDFVFIDTQHALFGLETIGHMAQAALALGVAAVVRVRGVDDPDMPLLLDTGVTGIVVPDVGTAEQARQAVRRCRFPPVGRRSVGGGYPQFDYRGVPVAVATAALNAATLLVLMIETVEGLENVEAIAAVDGVDVLHVGSNDLLVDMGKAGQFDDPAIVAAQDRVIAAARAHGRFAGCGGNRDVARQAEAVRRGAQFVTTQSDAAFLASAAGSWVAGVRSAAENPGAAP